MVRLQYEPIETAPLLAAARGDADGAVALFLGTVRDHNAGRRVRYLEYHAYEPMAQAELERIEADATQRFAVSCVGVIHRLGQLEIGECSVAVVVSSPHRAQAFDACRFVIDTLKQSVPIWKKEFFEGGKVWIEGAADTPAE